jgi:hypothetical protein
VLPHVCWSLTAPSARWYHGGQEGEHRLLLKGSNILTSGWQDFHGKHQYMTDVPNIWVWHAMRSLTARGHLKEQFNW